MDLIQPYKQRSKKPYSHNKITMNSYSIDILGPLRSAIRFAFNNEKNSVSDMFENNKYFAVFTIDEIIEPGIKPLMMLNYKLNKD